MSFEVKKYEKLSANALKIIALICMTCDHIGLFFGNIYILRLIGRIAFPIFAFFIAEGCVYTKNKAKHLGLIALFATVFQIVYSIAFKTIYISIFGTFTLSIVLIYLYNYYKNNYNNRSSLKYLSLLFLLFSIAIIYYISSQITFDYGFIGIVTPLCIYIFKSKKTKLISLLIMCLALSGVSIYENLNTRYEWLGYLSIFSMLSIPLLALYNGKKGEYNLKYLFYFYYPVHLVVLYIIYFFVIN